MKITRNAAHCLRCNTVIESKYRHDFQRCPCGDTFIDGGLDYIRVGFTDERSVSILTEYADEAS